MVSFPYKWKILLWDDKLQTNKKCIYDKFNVNTVILS